VAIELKPFGDAKHTQAGGQCRLNLHPIRVIAGIAHAWVGTFGHCIPIFWRRQEDKTSILTYHRYFPVSQGKSAVWCAFLFVSAIFAQISGFCRAVGS
jgi:hypothetical protein